MAKYKLLLPKMGESVAEATIIRWTKNPGDMVAADETVMEIATDKVDSDIPSPVAGKLTEQLCKENDVIQVGAVIAIIETADPEPAQPEAAATYNAFHEPQPESTEPQHSVPTPVLHEQPSAEPVKDEPKNPETGTQASQPVFEQRNDVQQPVPYIDQLFSSGEPGQKPMFTGRFYSPLVRSIAAQEEISAQELDKIPGTGAEGRLTKDDLLLYIENRLQQVLKQSAAGNNIEAMPAEPVAAVTPQPVIPENTIAQPEVQPVEPVQAAELPEPVKLTPPVPETAIKQEPLKPAPAAEAPEPVSAAAPVTPEPAANKPAASMSGGDEIIEMDRMRRLIAEHMVMSKHTSPHVTSFVEADVTNLVKWREKIKAGFEKREGTKITYTPLFIEAVAKAIKDMPMINVSVNGTQIIKKKDVNISMATALPNGNLIVPVIKNADELNIIGLTKAVNDLADRARNNKLKPDDVQGGTFAITNVGSFGNVMGTPIINQPQVAILAVGAIKKKPAVIETLEGDMIAIRHMMFLSLSYDHRVVDGALGGSFVRRVADYLENWDSGREI